MEFDKISNLESIFSKRNNANLLLNKLLYLGRGRITMTMQKGRQSSLRIIDIDGAGLSRPN